MTQSESEHTTHDYWSSVANRPAGADPTSARALNGVSVGHRAVDGGIEWPGIEWPRHREVVSRFAD